MERKATHEKINELEKKIEQLETRKIRLKNGMKEQERKERTRRLIQVGAIFEKYFEIEGVDQAEKVALGIAEQVKKNRNKLMEINIEQSQKEGRIILNNGKEANSL